MRTVGEPLAWVRSIKAKLGLLVAVSVVVAVLVAALASAGGVPAWLCLPVTVAIALSVTQLLATGMTAPLREMTAASRRMATGDYSARVSATSSDEVGELARAFNTMTRDLATVDRQRRELVANVSHELRTPLTALCAVLENLVDGVAPRDPAALEAALGQAERLSRLVEDLLDLAKVDAGKAPLVAEDVSVAGLLEEAVAEAGVAGRPVTFAVSVDPSLVARADRGRLHQLLANLIDNAARHSPSGGTVRLSASALTGASEGRYRIEVFDSGPGIAPADRERVFEPFGTLTGATGGGGTGLGLAIARWVTDLHGGVIAFVDPEPGESGARVRVDLPLTPPARPTPEVPMSVQLDRPPPPPPAPKPAAPRGILDDIFGAFWPDDGVPGRRGVLLAGVGAGVVGGLLLPFQAVGIGTFLVLAAAGGVLLFASPRRRKPFTRLCAVVCVLLASVTFVRDAEWLMALCLVTGIAVALVGVTGARSLLGIVLTGIAWPMAAMRGMPWLGRSMGAFGQMQRGGALLRTILLSVIALLVFGGLVASADALVAQWADDLLPNFSIGTFVLRSFVTVAVGGVVLAAAYVALNSPKVDLDAREPRTVVHRFEWLAPVLVVVGVFAAFLAAQATVVFGGHGYLQRTTGLTYADYSHQGFGQLTLATALTLFVVWAASVKAPRASAADRWWLRGSLGALCAMTLIVVGSALYRMHLYQEAYGFTRLRLLVDVFEGWLGVLVLVMLAGGLIASWAWVPRFALLSGAVGLLAIAALNPDAWIAQRNLDRYADTGRIDLAYLRSLSDDAVPVLDQLKGEERVCVLGGRMASDDNWAEWNLGRSRAAADLQTGPTAVSSMFYEEMIPDFCRVGRYRG